MYIKNCLESILQNVVESEDLKNLRFSRCEERILFTKMKFRSLDITIIYDRFNETEIGSKVILFKNKKMRFYVSNLPDLLGFH